MGFKKGGFPYYSFNPIGFRSRGIANKICGAFDFNGTNNLIDTGIVPDPATTEMEMSFIPDSVADEGVMGCRDGFQNNEFRVSIFNGQWVCVYGNRSQIGGTVVVGTPYTVRYAGGKLFINNSQTPLLDASSGTFGTVTKTVQFTLVNGTTNYGDLTVYREKLIHAGSTYIYTFDATNERVNLTVDDVQQPDPTISGTVTSGQWIDNCVEF